MKKCEYCGKEISYFDQYCNEDCHREANKFYELREKYTKLFSIINCICVFAIPVGIFLFSLHNTLGATIIAFALTILGLTVIALPFPTENMLSKIKIKNSIKRTRILGISIFVLGIICVIADFILFF